MNPGGISPNPSNPANPPNPQPGVRDPADPQLRAEPKYDFDRVVRMIIALGVVVGVFWLVSYLSDVLAPLAVAVLITYLLNPLVTRVDRRIRKRTFSVILIMSGAVVAGMILSMVAIPVIAHEWTGISAIIESLKPAKEPEPKPESATPEVSDQDPQLPVEPAAADVISSSEKSDGTPQLFGLRYQNFKERQSKLVQDWLTQGEQALTDVKWDQVALAVGNKITPGILGALSGIISIIMGISGVILVIIYVVFLLFSFPVYAAHWQDFIPPAYRQPVLDFAYEFADAMGRYFRGQFLIATATGVLYAIGFSVIGLRLAIPLGLFLGALNMVPYLQLVGVPIALLLGLIRAIESASPATAGAVTWSLVLVLIVFAVVQMVQDWVLTPRIMGKSTGLQPVVMMVGLFVWGKLLGFLGIVLAIPLTCIGIAMYRKYVLGQKLKSAAS